MARAKGHAPEAATDRERIASAMGELADRGYLLPFAAWDCCCTTCGWIEVARQVDADEHLPEDLKTVWWDELADSYAFCDDAEAMPQTQHYGEPFDDDAAKVDSVLARLTEYTKLVSPLFLHWRGDRNEIAAALRAQGLRVQVPRSESTCVAILPSEIEFEVQPVNGEVVIALDGDEIQLTTADARRLMRRLIAATRTAEAQLPRL